MSLSIPPSSSQDPSASTNKAGASQAAQAQSAKQPSQPQLCVLATVFLALAECVNVGSASAIARSQGLDSLNQTMIDEESSVEKLSIGTPSGSNVSIMQTTIDNENVMQQQATANAQMQSIQQTSSVGQNTIDELSQNINSTLSELNAVAATMTSVAYSATMTKPPA